ncbi:unannotated protein [freshwater metagenome]|uniref:Unannotated protein n=1 Tax=freshwater metagenome TaxID=449393 RepID=A0A6J6FCI0_9ZZZZ
MTLVARLGLQRRQPRLGIDHHRPELQHVEHLTMTSHTLLTEQHRTTIGQLHRQRDHRHHRCRHHQHHPGDHQIQHPLHEQLHVRRVRRLQVVQRLIRHRRRPQPPMTHPVQPVRHLDVHAALLERREHRHHPLGRDGAGHRDHAGHAVRLHHGQQLGRRAEVQRSEAVDLRLQFVAHHAHGAEARLGVLAQHRDQARRVVVGADHQDVAQVVALGPGGTEPGAVATAEPQQQPEQEHRSDDERLPGHLDAHRGQHDRLHDAEHDRREHEPPDLLGPARRHTGEVEALRVQHRETGRDQHRMDHEELPDRRALAELPHLHRRPCDRQRQGVEQHEPPPQVLHFELVRHVAPPARQGDRMTHSTLDASRRDCQLIELTVR